MTSVAAIAERTGSDPMRLRMHRVVSRRRETVDTVTLGCLPLDGGDATFEPGQFNMVTAIGAGEVPISISGRSRQGALLHTVRAVGPATAALCRARRGDVLGIRGPFGAGWRVEWPAGDLVVVAGGLGLAPLRSAISASLPAAGADNRRLFVLAGARTPADLLYPLELARWEERAGVQVRVIVDQAGPGWRGEVGQVTKLVAAAAFEPEQARAMVCGPEVMMRFTIAALMDRGVPAARIQVSLERNMKCGVGWCGHCQLGPFLLCRDGPVVSADRVASLMTVKEL